MSTQSFNEGDLVEAVNGKTSIKGEVQGCAAQFVDTSRRSIPHLISDGFTLTVIERAKPALPTAMYSIVRFPNKIPAMRFEDMLWYHIGYVGLFRGDDKQAGKTDAQLLADCRGAFEVAEFGVTGGLGE